MPGMLTEFWLSCRASVHWMHKATYEQVLATHGELTYLTQGTSMRPFIHSGEDLVTIRALGDAQPRCLDAILYRRDSGQYVLHRILGKNRRGYILCGDNRYHLEFGVRQDQILGVLTHVIRGGRSQSVDAIGYRGRVLVWCALYPVRAVVLFFEGKISFLWKRMRKLLKESKIGR